MTDPTPPGGAPDRLQAIGLKGSYSYGDKPLLSFYLPALAVSHRYDRMAGYYSSTSLRVTGPGIRAFLRNAQQRDGRMRLIVGTQLAPADVQAVREGQRSSLDVLAGSVTATNLQVGEGIPGDDYLALLAWMVREGLLQIKVGIPLDPTGTPLEPDDNAAYFHTKLGVLTDATGDRVAWSGSANETVHGWLKNHESFVVAKSWLPQVWDEQGRGIQASFDRHWTGHPDHDWLVADLTDVDDRFLKLVPKDFIPPDHDPIWGYLGLTDPALAAARAELAELAALPAAHRYTAALTAPAEPLPHQVRILHTAVQTYPRGYLFADPVGFGKTLELGFTIRELLLSGMAAKVLLLVPASVLIQWQEELAEKLGLYVPRYDGAGFLDHHGQPISTPPGANPWSAFPIVLASSHLARRRSRRKEILAAAPWDIVAVDEAHHARRRGSKPTDTPNTLLGLLTDLRKAGAWKALYLASATPMQMHPHEAWDLLALLGLPGRWGKSAADFQAYFEQLRLDDPTARDWTMLAKLVADYFSDHDAHHDIALAKALKSDLGAVKAKQITKFHSLGITAEKAAHLSPGEAAGMDRWLRAHTPVTDRAFRNTRDTLRAYQDAGIIPAEVNIPTRHVTDEFIDLDPAWERPLYDRIERYISRYYNAYMAQGSKALGFIMTVYRRRLTSSFYAIQCSLERRLAALQAGGNLASLVTTDDEGVTEDDPLFDLDTLDIALKLLDTEITELEAFVNELRSITGQDTKATRLMADLDRAFQTHSTVVVFTQYTDTMDYVRRRLTLAGYHSIGCYSGRGGELYNAKTKTWTPVTKTELKTRFRNGKVQILLGTDSMSEGLNLQTCSQLINYDMPWNLMRVEQRIGRVDRIGAARPEVWVTNYFYNDTVEESVYRGIGEDYADFTDIIGSAQPVLANIEKAIENGALTDPTKRGHHLSGAIKDIKDDIADAANAAVKVADFDAAAAIAPPDLRPGITVAELGAKLTSNPLTRDHLQPVDGTPGLYQLATNGPGQQVTFDRVLADTTPDTTLLTYGHPGMAALLNAGSASTVVTARPGPGGVANASAAP